MLLFLLLGLICPASAGSAWLVSAEGNVRVSGLFDATEISPATIAGGFFALPEDREVCATTGTVVVLNEGVRQPLAPGACFHTAVVDPVAAEPAWTQALLWFMLGGRVDPAVSKLEWTSDLTGVCLVDRNTTWVTGWHGSVHWALPPNAMAVVRVRGADGALVGNPRRLVGGQVSLEELELGTTSEVSLEVLVLALWLPVVPAWASAAPADLASLWGAPVDLAFTTHFARGTPPAEPDGWSQWPALARAAWLARAGRLADAQAALAASQPPPWPAPWAAAVCGVAVL